MVKIGVMNWWFFFLVSIFFCYYLNDDKIYRILFLFVFVIFMYELSIFLNMYGVKEFVVDMFLIMECIYIEVKLI